jgi:DNA-binding response OmpR family regulator
VVDATTPIVIVTIALRMDAHKPTALVVDDDASLRLLCRVNLELEGFSVREAATLQDAEDAVDAERPDVVLLDVHLGADESTSLLEWLRAAGIPVALVTGSADLRDLGAADAVLAKPFEPRELVEVARRLARVGA